MRPSDFFTAEQLGFYPDGIACICGGECDDEFDEQHIYRPIDDVHVIGDLL